MNGPNSGRTVKSRQSASHSSEEIYPVANYHIHVHGIRLNEEKKETVVFDGVK